jgi:primosomal protein N' (replication factor Y)
VLIQTRHPQHPLIQQLEAPYDSALPILLSQRSKAGLPPEGALAVIRCDSENRQEGMTFLSELKRSQVVDPDYQMIGPIPAAMARRKNRYRTQLVVAARGRAKLSTIVTSLVAVAESTRHSHRLKWFVDVDPYESL